MRVLLWFSSGLFNKWPPRRRIVRCLKNRIFSVKLWIYEQQTVVTSFQASCYSRLTLISDKLLIKRPTPIKRLLDAISPRSQLFFETLLKKGFKKTKFKRSGSYDTTPRYDLYLTHAHSHITRAVAATDSCFGLVIAETVLQSQP